MKFLPVSSPGCLFPPEQATRAGGRIISPLRHGGRAKDFYRGSTLIHAD
jgi:hypothetical protein